MLSLELVELNPTEKSNRLLVALTAEKANLINYAKSLDLAMQYKLALYFPILLIDIGLLSVYIDKLASGAVDNIRELLTDNPLIFNNNLTTAIENNTVNIVELNKVQQVQIKTLMHYLLLRAIGDTMSTTTLYTLYWNNKNTTCYMPAHLESTVNDIAINSLLAIEGKLKYINRYE